MGYFDTMYIIFIIKKQDFRGAQSPKVSECKE